MQPSVLNPLLAVDSDRSRRSAVLGFDCLLLRMGLYIGVCTLFLLVLHLSVSSLYAPLFICLLVLSLAPSSLQLFGACLIAAAYGNSASPGSGLSWHGFHLHTSKFAL